jgi:hypothetical protein
VAFGLLPGLAINKATGTISGTIAVGAAAEGPYRDGKRDAARTFWKGLDEIGRSRLDLFLCPDKRAMPLVAWCIMC